MQALCFPLLPGCAPVAYIGGMHWALRKLAALAGTAVAAASGAGASQLVAFIQVYLQRLGGHIDELRRTLEGLRSGALGAGIGDGAARDQLVASFAHRLEALEAGRDAIAQAGPFARPVAFARHVDAEIARAALDAFTPAVPVDTASVVFALAGVALGWALFDAACWPLRRIAARRRARRAAAAGRR